MNFFSSSISLKVKSSIGRSFNVIVIFHMNAFRFWNTKQKTTMIKNIMIVMNTPNNIK